jgi:lipopolysaccharide assembly protein A
MSAVRWILIIVAFAALLVLSVQNTQPARLTFFNLAAWEAPLILVVFAAFASGVAAGLLAGALRTARLKRQLHRFRREQRGGGSESPPSTSTVPGTSPASGPGFDRSPY